MKCIKILLFLLLPLLFSNAFSQVRLPRLIGNNAVLQRNTEVKIWGWAAPGENITLNFNNNEYKAKASKKGEWEIVLPPQKAGGPYSLTFQASNKITINNILFGDVWVCSGQSNMELTMQRVKDNYPGVIKNCENNNIRQFVVPDQYDFNKENNDLEGGNWISATPKSILGFSAVAYFFASEIYNKYKTPVGLINSALGGSPVEAWMSEEALKNFPEAYNEHQKFKDTNLIKEIQEKDKSKQNSWYSKLNNNDKGLQEGAEWFLENINDDGWEKMEVPGSWTGHTLKNTNGVVWFRKKITVPESMVGKKAKLWLGRIVDQDFIYVNGKMFGTTGYQYPPRKYQVKPGILKPGENTITARIIYSNNHGGFIKGKPYFLAVGNDTVDLKGTWKYCQGANMPQLEGQTFIRWKAGGLYNKMIAPLLNYNMKGVIWYQGESNAGAPDGYSEKFSTMIKSWREKWGIGKFPFIYAQLPNFMEETPEPAESGWAKLRQEQLNTLAVPNTAMAVTTDLGEWNDIHPMNKIDVGKRLALLANNLAYHEKEAPAGCPAPQKTVFKRKKVIIHFKNTGNGLIAKNNTPLKYFSISSDGENYIWANAKIKGNKVIVTADGLANPVAVRYAWANNPQGANLYTAGGLPASPFEVRKD